MMMPEGNGSAAVVMMVAAALTYDVISATNSSPQTTEINAGVRAETLMKWVNIGLIQASIFILLAAYMQYREGKSYMVPLLGGGLAGALLYAQYEYAKRKGLENPGPPTEKYGGIGAGETLPPEGPEPV